MAFFEKTFGAAPPEFGYKDWVNLYTAENWDPQAWAKLFKAAGATYVIPTGEHHDGFVNWDSDLTEWCATKKGPKRDLIGDLALLGMPVQGHIKAKLSGHAANVKFTRLLAKAKTIAEFHQDERLLHIIRSLEKK